MILGREVASLRGKKGPWALADWAKAYLTKRTQTKPTNSNPVEVAYNNKNKNEFGSLETPNNDLVGDVRESNNLAQDTSNTTDSLGEKNTLENKFGSLETPNNDMVDNSYESRERNILEISNDFHNEQNHSQDIQTEPAITTKDEEKSTEMYSDLNDNDVPSIHLTQNKLSTTLEPVKKEIERNRITEIDYSSTNRTMKKENVRLSTHYKTLNEIGVKYM